MDERAKATAEWERIHQLVDMACCSDLPTAYVGMYHLQQSKADWNGNPRAASVNQAALER